MVLYADIPGQDLLSIPQAVCPVEMKAFAAALPGLLATSALADLSLDHNEVPMVRDYLQVGGSYVQAADGEHYLQDQMYVEHLVPANGATQPYPLVLFHGAAQTSTNWLNKPDGGRGWASRFIEQGYELYLAEETSRGRSTWHPETGTRLRPPVSVEHVQQYFTAVQRYGTWAQAAQHTQWNGSGLAGDPVFDRFYAAQVQYPDNATYQQLSLRAAGSALLDRVGRPVVLLGHSQGGPLPVVLADARPHLVAALVLLEPNGPPFRGAVNAAGPARRWGVTDAPVAYDPPVADPDVELVKRAVPAPRADLVECLLQAEHPPPRRLVNVADKPVLVVTAEASYHAAYDYCTVEYLRQAGCAAVDFVSLPEVGIRGNGHMMFLEMNSDEIQGVVHGWVSRLRRGRSVR